MVRSTGPSEKRNGSDRNRTVWFGRPPCTTTTRQHIRRFASGYSSGRRPSIVVSRWALRLSLLTPYVQELGIPHAFASLVWLCGPLSVLLVQPLVGHMSDRSTSKFGRRRPYIVAGAVSILISVILVGFSADIGGLLGDPYTGSWPRAIAVFVVGFWILDVGHNVTQGPCPALLADLTEKDNRRTRIANAYFSLFMALGKILGYATGSYGDCVSAAKEVPLQNGILSSSEEGQQQNDVQEAFVWELLGSFRYISLPIWIIFIVTALTWVGWFPFTLFDTDWMGREIYKGNPYGGQNYHSGVRMGSSGLMLNSLVLGLTLVVIEKLCRKWGAGFVWGISNIFMTICFAAMLIISYVAYNVDYGESGLPPNNILIAALVVFTALGAPLAMTYSVPYAMISIRSEALGLGRGLAMGILNLSIAIPQMIVSLGSGPWDQLFGGGNSPAFAVGAISPFIGGLLQLLPFPGMKWQGKGLAIEYCIILFSMVLFGSIGA